MTRSKKEIEKQENQLQDQQEEIEDQDFEDDDDLSRIVYINPNNVLYCTNPDEDIIKVHFVNGSSLCLTDLNSDLDIKQVIDILKGDGVFI